MHYDNPQRMPFLARRRPHRFAAGAAAGKEREERSIGRG